MVYTCEINGIQTEAYYSENAVRDIFLPLLQHLETLQKEKGKRILVLLGAPPAAGKSTLLSFLKFLQQRHYPGMKLTTIGMDGFHRYQDYLLAHDTIRDGKTIRMVDVKGCPETFELEKLSEAVKSIAKGENIGWPDYNRMLHNPVEDATLVDGDIVLLEGNYLLLDEEGWRDLSTYADYTIRILANEEDLKERLVSRKIASGTPQDKAVSFVDRSDLYNARLVLNKSLPSDLTLRLGKDDAYYVESLL